MVDEEGKASYLREGDVPLKIRKNMRIGDIEIINPMPFDVIIDPKL